MLESDHWARRASWGLLVSLWSEPFGLDKGLQFRFRVARPPSKDWDSASPIWDSKATRGT
jgi:hypothetical protein